MDIKDERIDGGKAFDRGRTSGDYARFRDIYPTEFYEKIAARYRHFRAERARPRYRHGRSAAELRPRLRAVYYHHVDAIEFGFSERLVYRLRRGIIALVLGCNFACHEQLVARYAAGADSLADSGFVAVCRALGRRNKNVQRRGYWVAFYYRVPEKDGYAHKRDKAQAP